MAHTPVEPTGSVTTLALPEKTEIYLAPADAVDPLDAADLVPNTTGDVDVEPTRQITRVPLHNGQDFVSLGGLQGADFTIRCFLPDNNAKMQEIKDAYRDGTAMKGNVFFRDGSGASFFAYVLRVKTVDDPAGNEFAKDVTLSPFGITLLDAPAAP
ncbi:MAG TPA: hypothetical protein VFF10_06000 [Trueperaceae bacterium]|nr:hypothetical protein [Trueperaceae bacterium]